MEQARILQKTEVAAAPPAGKWYRGFGSASTPLVPKLIIFMLQFLILFSLVHLTYQVLFPVPSEKSANFSYLLLMGLLAIAVAFSIMAKFQLVIEDFALKSEKLERHLADRTQNLLKINEEMRSEISERKRVEVALNESEGRFRSIIREAAIGIAIIDQNRMLQEGNPALHLMMGYPPQGLQGACFTQLLLPEDASKNKEIFNELLHGYRANIQTEQRLVRKDGNIVWGRQSISMVRDISGTPKFFIAMIEDVTEAHLAEEKIRSYQDKLRSLASELSLSEERERRTLAETLHDHTGQLLCMAKIKLEELEDSAPDGSLQSSLKEIKGMIEKSINETRSLIYELSPPILYNVGFEAAVDWLAEDMRRQQHLAIKVEGDGQADQLGKEVRHLLFRAVRELLFNVIMHAQASQVGINIKGVNGSLQIIVADNGAGFQEKEAWSSANVSQGFGLFSIRERITYFGGSLNIESRPGQGTRVILTMPMDYQKKTRRARRLSEVACGGI